MARSHSYQRRWVIRHLTAIDADKYIKEGHHAHLKAFHRSKCDMEAARKKKAESAAAKAKRQKLNTDAQKAAVAESEQWQQTEVTSELDGREKIAAELRGQRSGMTRQDNAAMAMIRFSIPNEAVQDPAWRRDRPDYPFTNAGQVAAHKEEQSKFLTKVKWDTLKGKSGAIAFDASTLYHKKYVNLNVCVDGETYFYKTVRFGAAPTDKYQNVDGDTLVVLLEDVVKDCADHQFNVLALVMDNAQAGLNAADDFAPMEGMFAENEEDPKRAIKILDNRIDIHWDMDLNRLFRLTDVTYDQNARMSPADIKEFSEGEGGRSFVDYCRAWHDSTGREFDLQKTKEVLGYFLERGAADPNANNKDYWASKRVSWGTTAAFVIAMNKLVVSEASVERAFWFQKRLFGPLRNRLAKQQAKAEEHAAQLADALLSKREKERRAAEAAEAAKASP
eukprot:gene8256-4170_t